MGGSTLKWIETNIMYRMLNQQNVSFYQGRIRCGLTYYVCRRQVVQDMITQQANRYGCWTWWNNRWWVQKQFWGDELTASLLWCMIQFVSLLAHFPEQHPITDIFRHHVHRAWVFRRIFLSSTQSLTFSIIMFTERESFDAFSWAAPNRWPLLPSCSQLVSLLMHFHEQHPITDLFCHYIHRWWVFWCIFMSSMQSLTSSAITCTECESFDAFSWAAPNPWPLLPSHSQFVSLSMPFYEQHPIADLFEHHIHRKWVFGVIFMITGLLCLLHL